MTVSNYIQVKNGEAFKIEEIPILNISDFRDTVVGRIRNCDERIVSFFGAPHVKDNGEIRLIIVLANDKKGIFTVFSSLVKESYQALTPICIQAHMFEREIAEQWGVVPVGHPNLKPVRFHHSFNEDRDAWGRDKNDIIIPGDMEYNTVSGDGIHEVAVGPVHAGVIEPGHFRFQCEGEKVLNLEISLGFQHRGIEKTLIGGPDKKTIHLFETASGDSTVANTSAYCSVISSLGQLDPYNRESDIIAVALELERIANHTGDLGALAGDVAYLPTSAFCGRLRGDVLNMTADICGNRFGRNLLIPGGVQKNISADKAKALKNNLNSKFELIQRAVDLLWNTPTVLDRFENTGRIMASSCSLLGIVGMPSRACGLNIDSRVNFSTGAYAYRKIPIAHEEGGDVCARAMVRWQEIVNSKNFIIDILDGLSDKKIERHKELVPLMPDSCVVAVSEGWRGEICHTALTDSKGKFSFYKIVDPSFHNWQGLALALRNEEISNFPLCNKSFNLSYCGFDL